MYAPTATTLTPTRSWPKIALRWMPTFLGLPAGGLLAEVVGRVDSPGPAVVGGAITGATVWLPSMSR